MSENRTRLAAMQRAEKNIEERIENLTRRFHRQRQGAIDEELFDLISGYEALTKKPPAREGRIQKFQSNSTSSP